MITFSEYVEQKELSVIEEIKNLIAENMSFEEVQSYLAKNGIYLSEAKKSIWHDIRRETLGEIGKGLYDAGEGVVKGTGKVLRGGARVLASPITGTIKALWQRGKKQPEPEEETGEEIETLVHRPKETFPIPRATEPEQIHTVRSTTFTPPPRKKKFVSTEIRENGIKGLRTLMDEEIFGKNALKVPTIIDDRTDEEVIQIRLGDLKIHLTNMQKAIVENRQGKSTWNQIMPAVNKFLVASRMEQMETGQEPIITFQKMGIDLT